MPFAPLNFVGMMAALGAARRRRSRCGATARSRSASRSTRCACVFAFAVPSAIGNNITRLGICFGVALVVDARAGRSAAARCCSPPRRCRSRSPSGCRRARPLLGEGNAVDAAAYFQPLLRFLRPRRPPARARRGRADRASTGRPPTSRRRSRSRAAGSASSTPPTTRSSTRRGGSRDATYRRWLFANGVRFVALPDVALDYAAKAEGAARARRRARAARWSGSSAHWRVYRVAGAPGPGQRAGAAAELRAAPSVLLQVTARGRDRRARALRQRLARRARRTPPSSAAPGGWLRVRARRARAPVELRVDI